MMKFTPIVMDLNQRVHVIIDRVKRIAHCRYTVTNVPKTWVKLAIRVIWWAFFLNNRSKIMLLEWFVKWIGGIHRDNYWLQKGNHMAWVGFNWPFDTFHWLCKSRTEIMDSLVSAKVLLTRNLFKIMRASFLESHYCMLILDKIPSRKCGSQVYDQHWNCKIIAQSESFFSLKFTKIREINFGFFKIQS